MIGKVIKIKNETYDIDFWWFRVNNAKDFNETLKKYIPDVEDQMILDSDNFRGETVPLTYQNNKVICFWFIEKDFAGMSHELLHSTIICLRDRGVILSEESEEAYCYLFDWLISKIMRKQCKKQPETLKLS